ncbi:hypothetical protein [Pontiella sp.]|uniref:hypothetical protein n=2 Tax=Pontiella sp. TaxID=2837462 RepID=UPI003562F459
MRRSILIVMLDVMVLSVLALTARQRAGGGAGNIPLPAGGMSRMLEEGLRNETAYRDQIARLEAQLKETTALSRAALERADLAEAKSERDRAANLAALEKLRQAELAAAAARSDAEVASREAELVNRQALLAKQRTLELEQKEREAKERADAALVQMKLAEQKAAEAQRKAKLAEQAGAGLDSAVLAAKEDAARARAERDVAQEQLQQLNAALTRRAEELAAAKTEAAEAAAKASVALSERERLAGKNEEVTQKLVQATADAAALEERGKSDKERVARLEAEKQAAVEELGKSVWTRRDDALRRVRIRYTERKASNGQLYQTDKELAIPLVKVGGFTVVPAEFDELGLKKSFFGGLSDRVTDVKGVAAPMVGEGKAGTLQAIMVPATEPQVCLVHVVDSTENALEPITMEGLKQRRLRVASLFSAKDVNAYGLVEIIPMLGRDYLTVRTVSGRRPDVGDYLLTDRGEFIGIMVKSDVCHVLPAKVASSPKPVIIPLRSYGQQETYLGTFIDNLNRARELHDRQADARGF